MHKINKQVSNLSLSQPSVDIEENSTDILYCVFNEQGRVVIRYHDEDAAKKHAENIGGYVHKIE